MTGAWLLTFALAAADGTSRDVHEILRARWGDWIGDATEVRVSDLDEEIGSDALHGEEAAACAALVQTLHFMQRKRQVDHLEREALLAGTDHATDRVLTGSYTLCLRKRSEIPSVLWSEGGPHFEAVSQHGDRTGDCWLLAPTGWMVRNRPEVVRAAIVPVGERRWRVTFPSGASAEVGMPTETELIATNATATLKDGLWLPVIKEAMGTVVGLRNARKAAIESEALRLNGGSMPSMMQHWTGHRTRTIRLEGQASIDEVRAAIADAIRRKALVGLGTGKEPAGMIPPNHAFAVFGLSEDGRSIDVWNPWHDDFRPKGEPGPENGYPRDAGLSTIPLADAIRIFRAVFIETAEPFDGTKPPRKPAIREASDADAKPAAKP